MNNARTIFIGDVHGCYDEFKLLIKKLEIQKNDTVYLVGDMINKGPKSWKMLKFLYKNQEQYKAIKGNHETGFFDWLEGKKPEYENDIYKKIKNKLEKHPHIGDYLKKLPLYIEKDNFLLIHGGLDPNKKLVDHTEYEITHIREVHNAPWFEQYIGDKKVIYGHWAINGLNIVNNTIGLDGGCVYGRVLHAYILESGDVITQQALKCYQDVFIKD